jgi:sarcosine oxidase subunit alpha
MLSTAVKKYADFFGVKCGEKNVFFTNNDSAYESALCLFNKGIKVDAIIDIRNNSNSKIVKAVEQTGIKIYWSHTVVDTNGYKRLNNISIMKLSNDGMTVTGNRINISCDCLGVAGGWTPAVHLFTQSGGKLNFDENNKVFLPNKYPSDQLSVGSCNGDFNIKEIIK